MHHGGNADTSCGNERFHNGDGIDVHEVDAVALEEGGETRDLSSSTDRERSTTDRERRAPFWCAWRPTQDSDDCGPVARTRPRTGRYRLRRIVQRLRSAPYNSGPPSGPRSQMAPPIPSHRTVPGPQRLHVRRPSTARTLSISTSLRPQQFGARPMGGVQQVRRLRPASRATQ